MKMKRDTFVSLLLRIGIAFSFLYVALRSFTDPTSWIGFFPVWVLNIATVFVSEQVLLSAFSVFEIFLAIWLLSGRFTFFAALMSAAMLLGIVVVNVGAMDLVFRDISIFFAALALAVVSRYKEGANIHELINRGHQEQA